MHAWWTRIARFWQSLSRLGTAGHPFSEARRIVLSNQVSFLGLLVPQFYNAFYAWYDLDLLKGPILVNVIGSCVSGSVMHFNAVGYHQLARMLIIVSPNVQIFFLTYFLSTATGMHLLHIMMVSFTLFLLSNQSKVKLLLVSSFPIGLFIASYLLFTPEASPIMLDADTLQGLYISLSLTVFILVMVFFSLFYSEMLMTERLLENEFQRSERLLINILPEHVAQRLKTESGTIAELHPSVTILFSDIVGFTGIASSMAPHKLVEAINRVFSRFDELADRHGLEKIKTIGDAYMVAGGIPAASDNHTEAVALMALEMVAAMRDFRLLGEQLGIRIGFHTGPVVAGVIGTRKFSYDIWGEAVNMASRLESTGMPGRIHVSAQVYSILEDGFRFEKRERIQVKGIGEVQTYFLDGRV